MELGIEVREVSGIPVLAIRGDLDGVLVDEFERAVIETAQDSKDCVVVDLTDVTYIDSQSFGRLLKAHVMLERVGGDVAIVAGASQVARVIKTFGADYLLAVFDSVDKAAQYLLPLVEAHV
jgi:anti-anti-sigma factor